VSRSIRNCAGLTGQPGRQVWGRSVAVTVATEAANDTGGLDVVVFAGVEVVVVLAGVVVVAVVVGGMVVGGMVVGAVVVTVAALEGELPWRWAALVPHPTINSSATKTAASNR
jgi:hypothetical protein